MIMKAEEAIKVMIADDETKVCQLIKCLINWEELGMRVVSIVHNGIDALKQIENDPPDIVITDIRMPGCDGLEMIAKAKQISCEIDFIIISGYRHFEYAQNAIKYGVKDYLLKPINKMELQNILRVIKKKDLHKLKSKSKIEELLSTIKNDSQRIRVSLLLDCINNSQVFLLQKANEEYHYHFKDGLFQVIIFKLDGLILDDIENQQFIEYKISYKIDNALKEYCYDYEKKMINTTCYLLINYNQKEEKAIRKGCKEILDQLRLEKDIYKNIKVTVGVGITIENIKDCYQSFRTATWAIEERIIKGPNQIFYGGKCKPRDLSNLGVLSEFNNRVSMAIDRLAPEPIGICFDYLYEVMKNINDINGSEALQMLKDSLNIYFMNMKQKGLYNNDLDICFKDYCNEIENEYSIEEIINYIKKIVVHSYNMAITEKKQQDYKPIREAKKYIDNNYCNKITLEMISMEIGFNATYFSTLFKKETGTTFFEYLTKIRMEKAKEFLKETNDTITNICEKVGYSDVKYFTKVFKKNTNLKPNEYRKLYS